ncbi:54S ribosomal protein L22, mitochondrial [Rhizoclosmatium sp. JEL0117]|nr:54S ribosomal protein L22, mitochondrial [Rhizoclosmatium sp. JEL0117]
MFPRSLFRAAPLLRPACGVTPLRTLPSLVPTCVRLTHRPNYSTSSSSASPLMAAALSEAEVEAKKAVSVEAASTSSLMSSTALSNTASNNNNNNTTTNNNNHPNRVHVKCSPTRQSPKKLNLVAKVARGLPVANAIVQMKFSPKRAAAKVDQALRLAKRIADQKDKEAVWIVKECFVGKAKYLKRMKPHARGRMGIMHHPAAHVTVVLEKSNKIYALGKLPLEESKEHKQAREFDKLVHIFKRHRLYAPFKEAKPRFLNPVWSRKSFKYVTSEKWLHPKL